MLTFTPSTLVVRPYKDCHALCKLICQMRKKRLNSWDMVQNYCTRSVSRFRAYRSYTKKGYHQILCYPPADWTVHVLIKRLLIWEASEKSVRVPFWCLLSKTTCPTQNSQNMFLYKAKLQNYSTYHRANRTMKSNQLNS